MLVVRAVIHSRRRGVRERLNHDRYITRLPCKYKSSSIDARPEQSRRSQRTVTVTSFDAALVPHPFVARTRT
jgi:hypothetical protein